MAHATLDPRLRARGGSEDPRARRHVADASPVRPARPPYRLEPDLLVAVDWHRKTICQAFLVQNGCESHHFGQGICCGNRRCPGRCNRSSACARRGPGSMPMVYAYSYARHGSGGAQFRCENRLAMGGWTGETRARRPHPRAPRTRRVIESRCSIPTSLVGGRYRGPPGTLTARTVNSSIPTKSPGLQV